MKNTVHCTEMQGVIAGNSLNLVHFFTGMVVLTAGTGALLIAIRFLIS